MNTVRSRQTSGGRANRAGPRSRSVRPWTPAQLFQNNEQGAWYDPSDMSTMFRDPGGLLPCFAANNTVGLLLDKRFGLKTTTEMFGSVSAGGPFTGVGQWVNTSGATSLAVVNGELVATLLNAGSTWSLRLPSQNLVGGVTYKVSLTVRQSAAFAQGGVALSLYNQTTSTAIGSTGIVQQLVNGELQAYYTPPASGAFSIIVVGSTDPADFGKTITMTKASCAVLPGSHMLQGVSASRPTLRQVGSLWHLEFDGTDDFMATYNIPMNTDKMHTHAAFRKLSDVSIGMLVEFSANSSTTGGSFFIDAPSGAGSSNFGCRFYGTILRDRATPTTYPAPYTAVISGKGDIAAGTTRIMLNGVIQASDSSGLGTGIFGTQVLYLGRRGGVSLPFGGNLYGMVIRNALMDDVDVLKVDRFLGVKAGLTF